MLSSQDLLKSTNRCTSLAKTIAALSEKVYKKLKHLRDSLDMGYSELIDMLIETYKRYRVEETMQ